MSEDNSFNKFLNDIRKNLGFLKSDLKSIEPQVKEVSSAIVNLSDNSENKASPYQMEIENIKSMMLEAQKYQSVKNQILSGLASDEKTQAQGLMESYEETLPVLEMLGADTKEFANIFSSTFDKMLEKSESFGDSMKKMLDDLKNYMIKTIAKAISDSILNSGTASTIMGSLNSEENNNGFGVFNILKSFLGFFSDGFISSHHSGGVIPSGASYSLPGTKEYLALLKGGERVLSPSENSAYSNDKLGQNQVVVNNFNIKSWDSKDVQNYLLENKNLIANITADNIKYNNANLRYMIGGA